VKLGATAVEMGRVVGLAVLVIGGAALLAVCAGLVFYMRGRSRARVTVDEARAAENSRPYVHIDVHRNDRVR
jgi:hypothetical protein